jgi:hypothetical protein
MPALDTTQLADPDLLQVNGNLIAWMVDYNGNDTIDFPEVPVTNPASFPFGLYGVSVSSMGQIAFDTDENLYVTFSSCREDLMNTGAMPNVELYRHLYLTTLTKGADSWSDPVDLNNDIEHAYDECVFASLADNVSAHTFGFLDVVYQIDPEPGNSIGSDVDDPSDNYINYLSLILPYSIKPVDISKDVMISPNPANDFADVLVSLSDPQKVQLNVYDVMGKQVISTSYGQQSSGYHKYQVITSELTSGVYLFTVKIGNSQTSRKVVVN